jgi:hypothetical protein
MKLKDENQTGKITGQHLGASSLNFTGTLLHEF